MSGVLPGTTVTIGDAVPRNFTPGDTGTAFVVGAAQRGPVAEPQEVTSLSSYVSTFGERTSDTAVLYDTLDVAFRAGLGRAVVGRLVGADAKAATDDIMDGAGEEAAVALQIDAANPGAWGNDLDWEVTAGDGEGAFKITVTYDGTVVASSPDLTTSAEAVAWAADSSWITLTDKAGGNPAVSEGGLSGGDDDLEDVDAETIEDTLTLFTDDLGPGQVAAPGYTAEAVHKVLVAHAVQTIRTPILDLEDTGTANNLLSDAAALRAVSGSRHAGAFAPWRTVPGVALGTTRTVPPCATVLGEVAASDRANGHANIAVAGPAGKSSYALGVSQTYTAQERADLNAAGVNVAIMDEGQVTNYGWRTLANPVTEKNWVSLAAARLMMGLAFGAKRVLKRKEFANLDAQGETRSSAEGAIVNEVVSPLFTARAIFGDTPEDACAVEVTQVVDPDDGSVGKLTGSLAAKPSPFAERIEFTVVNVPVTESL